MSSHLKTKIIVGALGLAMLPMIVLTWFTYQVFDVRCTQLLDEQYAQAVEFAGRDLRLLRNVSGRPLTEQNLAQVFDSIELFDNGTLQVLDSDGTVLYHRAESDDWIDQSISAHLDKLHFETQLEDTGWIVTFDVDKVKAQSELYVLRGMLILVIMLCAISVVWGASRLSNNITRPLSDMMEQMNRMERGELKVNIAVDSDDEIGVLAKKFNTMSRNLQTYIDRYYVARMQQGEAELKALRTQISPHYLNNMLEVIRMQAISEDAPVAAHMTEMLGQQMQYALSDAASISLHDELDLIRNYVSLLNFRYNDKLQLDIQEKGFGSCEIPKLSLQPLVENAYKHGLKNRPGLGLIQITAEAAGDDLEITVLDNGIGMSKGVLTELKKQLQGTAKPRPESQTSGIGLKNVHDRLKSLYGEGYGLSISSWPGVGTAICLKIPRHIKEETEHVEFDSGR